MHIPVLIKETIEFLDPSRQKTYVDCTLGFGGHTSELLQKGAKVIGIDCDGQALKSVREKLGNNPNLTVIHDNFANIKYILKEPVDGILFDFGVSSYQIDNAERGFSIKSEGPLDMRMDLSQGKTAAEVINSYEKEELEKIFFEYGEERFSRRIVAAILKERKTKPISTTGELSKIVSEAIPTWKKRESVTRIFQALRIEVNSELENIKAALGDAISLLKPGGRLVAISFHSLEDRIVKRFFKEQKENGILEVLTKKPVMAGEDEAKANPRSRSAKLRAARKKE